MERSIVAFYNGGDVGSRNDNNVGSTEMGFPDFFHSQKKKNLMSHANFARENLILKYFMHSNQNVMCPFHDSQISPSIVRLLLFFIIHFHCFFLTSKFLSIILYVIKMFYEFLSHTHSVCRHRSSPRQYTMPCGNDGLNDLVFLRARFCNIRNSYVKT